MRLFVAIPLSQDTKEFLENVENEMQKNGMKGNYVPSNRMHITLVFIGDYSNINKIIDIMASIPMPSTSIKINTVNNFNKQLYYANVEPNSELHNYAAALKGAFNYEGIPFDRKDFKPHITLCRKAEHPVQPVFDPIEMPVTEAVLYNSVTENGKLVYQPLYVQHPENTGELIPLSDAKIDQDLFVKKIDSNEQTKARLNSLGLIENTKVRILQKKHNGTLILNIRGTRFALGSQISREIEVIQ